MRHAEVTLDDKFLLTEGRVFITGVQALLRVLIDQHRLDQQAGLNTAGFVSGYRGSPLGGLDQQAGRARKQDPVVHSAGIDLHVKPGQAVKKGDPLFTMGTEEPERFARALEALEGSYEIGDEGSVVQDGGALIQGKIG